MRLLPCQEPATLSSGLALSTTATNASKAYAAASTSTPATKPTPASTSLSASSSTSSPSLSSTSRLAVAEQSITTCDAAGSASTQAQFVASKHPPQLEESLTSPMPDPLANIAQQTSGGNLLFILFGTIGAALLLSIGLAMCSSGICLRCHTSSMSSDKGMKSTAQPVRRSVDQQRTCRCTRSGREPRKEQRW
eukprot:CAMPEP_0119302296 /NCGR_PEP_ID=MMETSP1333-20130426/3916_1 /TAXON_ID=418940 /ORGANISM="Scyphosphaera apsteinii, Strain RCC1455" /LENGTH=192 /DNA_ID=CAMNT_0007304609 /DNA_START=686 /DNA_END=1262 /DNA_ORIENTATION=+